MSTATLRASYSISAPTLMRFNATIPAGERSKVVERLMLTALAQQEAVLEEIARQYMEDPVFQECRTSEAAWDAAVADGLEGV
jgi:hypothetical protein